MNEITRRRFLQFIGGGAGAVAFSSLFFRPIWASIPAFRPVSSSLLGVDRNGYLCHLAPFGFCLIVLSFHSANFLTITVGSPMASSSAIGLACLRLPVRIFVSPGDTDERGRIRSSAGV
jgi:hypothetical protein